jgi:CheY-like chemotaxis protein
MLNMLKGLIRKSEWNDLPNFEIIKRSKILIIDDDPFPYKDLLKKDGYNTDYWNGNIDNTERIENGYYDIILLDFHGVGTDFSNNQGIGVLEYIKRKNPAQIVIGVSNMKWDLENHIFINLANTQMSKRQPYADFKSNIDNLLKERFSKTYYISLLSQYYPEVAHSDIEKFLNKSLRKQKPLMDGMPTLLDDKKLQSVITITNAAINTYKIVMAFKGVE